MFGGELSAPEQVLERFLDSASRGDLSSVRSLLSSSPSLLNTAGGDGWTALMFSCRNGHYQVVKELLKHSCDTSLLNRSSQSAFDIAKFWGHTHICRLLLSPDPNQDSNQRPGSEQDSTTPLFQQSPHQTYFSAEPLDRLSAKRPDQDWVRSRLSDPHSVFLLFHKLSPMVCSDGGESEAQSRLVRFRPEQVQDLLQSPDSVLVFLGVDRRADPGPQTPGWDPPAWFALGSDSEPEELLKRSREKHSGFPRNAHRDLLKLSQDEAGILAQARSVLAWHGRYGYCSTCGSSSRVEEAGHKRSCESEACISHQGVHNTCYPRVDPVVIMLVLHPDQNQVLLGRKKVFPSGMFSCLAGFIEPGECMEAAVRREVQEESGVQVGPVWYVCSQPWPMPSSLMIGCFTVAVTTEINVDQDEIEEAKWFTRQQVVDSLLGVSGAVFSVPPRQTISHQLLRHWTGLSSHL